MNNREKLLDDEYANNRRNAAEHTGNWEIHWKLGKPQTHSRSYKLHKKKLKRGKKMEETKKIVERIKEINNEVTKMEEANEEIKDE